MDSGDDSGDETMIDVGGVRLCAQSLGDPGRPALVLVGGAAASMDWWDDDFCARLVQEGLRVVRYDHRDTGRSDGDPPGAPTYDGERLALDLVGLLDGLGIDRAHLLGVSMGGGIVQRVALTRPDRVATLTVVASSPAGGIDSGLPGPTPAVAAGFEDPPADPDWADREAVVAWYLAGERIYAGALGVEEDDVRRAAGRGWDRGRDPAAAGNHFLALESGDGEPVDVHDLAAPVLVVHGSDDPLFPLAHGRALAEAVPGARLEVVEGMGHQVPPRSSWDQVVPRILALTAT